jgi:hypothetical protein
MWDVALLVYSRWGPVAAHPGKARQAQDENCHASEPAGSGTPNLLVHLGPLNVSAGGLDWI